MQVKHETKHLFKQNYHQYLIFYSTFFCVNRFFVGGFYPAGWILELFAFMILAFAGDLRLADRQFLTTNFIQVLSRLLEHCQRAAKINKFKRWTSGNPKLQQKEDYT